MTGTRMWLVLGLSALLAASAGCGISIGGKGSSVVSKPANGSPSSAGTATKAEGPAIRSVSFSGQPGSLQNLTITVRGSGFGSAPVNMPYAGNIADFSVMDNTQGGWQAGCDGTWRGSPGPCGVGSGNSVTLHYRSWSDRRIVIQGFGHAYGGNWILAEGDSLTVAVRNAQNGRSTVWNGDLALSGAASGTATGGPVIQSVSFNFNSQMNPRITIDGSGFGPSPFARLSSDRSIVGNVVGFSFKDNTSNWQTGGQGTSAVIPSFRSWTDTRIVLGSFHGNHSLGGGDSVTVQVTNSATGASTSWTGTLK